LKELLEELHKAATKWIEYVRLPGRMARIKYAAEALSHQKNWNCPLCGKVFETLKETAHKL
jgi:hypothetical protein